MQFPEYWGLKLSRIEAMKEMKVCKWSKTKKEILRRYCFLAKKKKEAELGEYTEWNEHTVKRQI